MGLDVTAYRQLTPAPHAQLDEDGSPVEWDKFVLIRDSVLDWTEGNWPGRTAPLRPGIYAAGEQDRFGAGSYSGYGAWRDWLARRAGYPSARAVQNGITSGPFVELINFADNEGYIGSTVAAKLAKDFAENKERICGEDDTWSTHLYAKWQAAFEMAADGGCVDFH